MCMSINMTVKEPLFCCNILYVLFIYNYAHDKYDFRNNPWIVISKRLIVLARGSYYAVHKSKNILAYAKEKNNKFSSKHETFLKFKIHFVSI